MMSKIILISLFCLLGLIVDGNAQIKAFSEPSFKWLPLDQAVGQARVQQKMVLVLFKTKDCPFCKKMELEVFSKPEFQKEINKYFIPAVVDLESNDQYLYKGDVISVKGLATTFRVSGTPTLVFLNTDGDLVAFQPGYIKPDTFHELIDYIGTGMYATVSFQEFQKQDKE
ncbi:DUF255 domain-containing protein [bacterium]|nr:MAG: DUF255 domain-containing protein [bacterium]